MKNLTLALFVLLGVGFALGCVYLLMKSSPELKATVLLRLQTVGQKNFNFSASQPQHAVFFGALHFFIIAFGAICVWLITHHPLVSLVVACILYFIPGQLLKRKLKKRLTVIESELPDALLFIANALRAGSSLSVALEVLVRDQRGPLGEEFAIVLKEQRLGVSFDDSIQKMSLRLGIADFVLVAVAMRVSKQVGGNLSEPLQILATTLRRKAILEGRIIALTAQGKIQGLVMTLFPLLLLAILYVIQPSTKLLFTTNLGLLVMSVICVMLYLGYVSIKKLVAIDI